MPDRSNRVQWVGDGDRGHGWPNFPLLIATIEHSGTHTLLQLLGWREDGRGRDTVPLEEIHRAREGSIVNAHLYDSLMERIFAAAERMPVITTSRPVADIRASWVRRGRDLAQLDSQLHNYERLMACRPYVLALGKKW